jgi:hypothetical protein
MLLKWRVNADHLTRAPSRSQVILKPVQLLILAATDFKTTLSILISLLTVKLTIKKCVVLVVQQIVVLK